MDAAGHPALAALGYSPRWLEFGLLSLDVLEGQLSLLRSGRDTSTEHYRYGAFLEALQTQPLTDETVARLVELAQLDPHAANARSMLVELLRDPALSDAAFAQVAAALGDAKEVRRHTMLRELARVGPTPVVLARCLATRDGDVHEALLRIADLPREYVEELAEHGAWRRVRNAAAARLKRRAA